MAAVCCGAWTSYCSGFSCGAHALDGWASAVAAQRLTSCGLWALEHGLMVVAHGLSCSVACEVFLDQGLNLCLLRWPADCYPLCHQESSRIKIFKHQFFHLCFGVCNSYSAELLCKFSEGKKAFEMFSTEPDAM